VSNVPEHWCDRFQQMAEVCQEVKEDVKRSEKRFRGVMHYLSSGESANRKSTTANFNR